MAGAAAGPEPPAVLEAALLVGRDGVDRDGARQDGVDRDGARRDGARRDRPVAAGVAPAATGPEVPSPPIPAVAAPDEAGVAAAARTVTPVVSGTPSHGDWGAIRSRAGTPSVSYCVPIGEPFGR